MPTYGTWSNTATGTTDTEATPPPSSGDTTLNNLTYFQGFNNASNGQALYDFEGLRGCDNATCTTSEYYPGSSASKCMRTYIDPGNEGDVDWGKHGYTFYLSAYMPQIEMDGEIWWRHAVKFPSGYNYTTPVGKLKWFRFAKAERANTDNTRGLIDYYIKTSGEVTQIVETANPSSDHYWQDTGYTIPQNQWIMVEYYCRLGAVAKDDGGTAEIKLWIDGVQRQHLTNVGMVRPEYDPCIIRECQYMPIWNQHTPDGVGRQTHHIDQIAIAVRGNTKNMGYIDDTQWMSVDGNSFPFIGMEVG